MICCSNAICYQTFRYKCQTIVILICITKFYIVAGINFKFYSHFLVVKEGPKKIHYGGKSHNSGIVSDDGYPPFYRRRFLPHPSYYRGLIFFKVILWPYF